MYTTSAARSIPRLPGSPRRTSSSRPSSRSGHSVPSPGRAHQLRFVLPSSPPLRVSLRVRILLSELRNEYRPSFDPTVVQVGDRLVDLAQRVEGGGQAHSARSRERHEFRQIGVAAHEVTDDVLLAEDHVDCRYLDGAAVADDVVGAGVAGHGEALHDVSDLSDEFQNVLDM